MVILALDVSTVCVGVCLLNSKTLQPIELFSIDLKKYDTLIEKANEVESRIRHTVEVVEVVAIEEPLMMFAAGSSSAQVISKLAQFNGAIQLVVGSVFNMEPILVNVNTARKKAFPDVKFPKGCKRKQVVFERVTKEYQNIIWKRKRTGTPSDDSYDISDAIVVARAIAKSI